MTTSTTTKKRVNYDFQDRNQKYTFEIDGEKFIFSPYQLTRNCVPPQKGDERHEFIQHLKSFITWDAPLQGSMSSGQVYAGVIPQHYEASRELWGEGVISEEGLQLIHKSHSLYLHLEEGSKERIEKLFFEVFGYQIPDIDALIRAEQPMPVVHCWFGMSFDDAKMGKRVEITQSQALDLKRSGHSVELYPEGRLGAMHTYSCTVKELPSSDQVVIDTRQYNMQWNAVPRYYQYK